MQMKALPLFLLMIMPLLLVAQLEGEIIRIKIEWLNAEECGIEGCKPQSLVMRNGESMTFGWPGIPDRGLFEVKPVIHEGVVLFDLKRMTLIEEGIPEVIAAEVFKFNLEESAKIEISELRWEITVTLEE
ncbi:MAG: hypothetical protein SynsKO_21400 [Synoicihabitans sp.]